MKDLLVGATDLYDSKGMHPWIMSARESGFDGDIWLIVYRKGRNWNDKIFKDYDVKLYEVTHNQFGKPIIHQGQGWPTQVHHMRFFHTWELLFQLQKQNYRFCIMTDARDVLFQKNPSIWLEQHLSPEKYRFAAPSEAIDFLAESWNLQNMIAGYGSMAWLMEARDWRVYNVGVVAGYVETMRHLANTIFRMVEGRYYPSDQSSFNILIHGAFAEHVLLADLSMAWVAPLGTTHDPKVQQLWEKCVEPRPVILPDGIVINQRQDPFVMLHQWDRVPDLKKMIDQRYDKN